AKEVRGLKDTNVNLTHDAVDQLIKWYTRESGVRNLKKSIEKVLHGPSRSSVCPSLKSPYRSIAMSH
ncbi:hypothetical protein BKA70DRAFT_1120856, partial [Coprinopsis sp. MPI-PUGE-AT-0042]